MTSIWSSKSSVSQAVNPLNTDKYLYWFHFFYGFSKLWSGPNNTMEVSNIIVSSDFYTWHFLCQDCSVDRAKVIIKGNRHIKEYLIFLRDSKNDWAQIWGAAARIYCILFRCYISNMPYWTLPMKCNSLHPELAGNIHWTPDSWCPHSCLWGTENDQLILSEEGESMNPLSHPTQPIVMKSQMC